MLDAPRRIGRGILIPYASLARRNRLARWAISLAGLIRLPILFLYLGAIRRGTVGTLPPDAMDQEIDLAEE